HTAQPFLHYPRVAISQNGQCFALSESLPTAMENGRIRVRVWHGGGSLVFDRWVSRRAQPVQTVDFNRFIDSISAPTRTAGILVRANRTMLVDSLVRTSSWPPVEDLVVD